jgi:hypothetical protein
MLAARPPASGHRICGSSNSAVAVGGWLLGDSTCGTAADHPSALSTKHLLGAALWSCTRLFPIHYPPPTTNQLLQAG